jgi:hypothetical protein
MASFTDGDVSLTRGDTDFLDGTAVKPDGTPQDLTGWTIRFIAKRRFSDPDAAAALLKSTGGGGITITNAAQGLYTVAIVPADTAGLANGAQTFYGWAVGTDPLGEVNTLWEGLVRLGPGGFL